MPSCKEVGNAWLSMERKVADLDHECAAWQRIRLVRDLLFIEIRSTVSDAVICDLRIVKHHGAALRKYFEAESEVAKDRLVGMFAIDEA